MGSFYRLTVFITAHYLGRDPNPGDYWVGKTMYTRLTSNNILEYDILYNIM